MTRLLARLQVAADRLATGAVIALASAVDWAFRFAAAPGYESDAVYAQTVERELPFTPGVFHRDHLNAWCVSTVDPFPQSPAALSSSAAERSSRLGGPLPGREDRPEQPRLSVHINSHTQAELQNYRERQRISLTEAVRRLIGIGAFIAVAMGDDTEVMLRRGGKTERVIFDLK